MITMQEGEAKTSFWGEGGHWWWGYGFDSGINGPFASFDAAVEDWRKHLSRQRGQHALRVDRPKGIFQRQ